MKSNKDIAHTPGELFTEMQALVAEAQAMMADGISDGASEGLEVLRERFAAAQKSFAEAYAHTRKRVVDGARYTDETIRANPYQAIAVSAGLGILIGVLISRRSR